MRTRPRLFQKVIHTFTLFLLDHVLARWRFVLVLAFVGQFGQRSIECAFLRPVLAAIDRATVRISAFG